MRQASPHPLLGGFPNRAGVKEDQIGGDGVFGFFPAALGGGKGQGG
jgi:hypothetical protein